MKSGVRQAADELLADGPQDRNQLIAHMMLQVNEGKVQSKTKSGDWAVGARAAATEVLNTALRAGTWTEDADGRIRVRDDSTHGGLGVRGRPKLRKLSDIAPATAPVVPPVPPVPGNPGHTGAAAQLLADVEHFIRRFTILPAEDAYVAVTLWVIHSHAIDCFESTPRLAALSPEPGSGKTRLLEVLELLVPNPMLTFNVSAAVLYRSMSADKDGNVAQPTIMLDEADTVFGPRASKDHEDLRGFVNAGYRRGATAQRCSTSGKNITIETFPAFAAVVLAGLDDLPDTIMTRSIVLRMRRRAPHEVVEPFRRRLHAPQGEELSYRIARWVIDEVHRDLRDAWPDLPESITDRNADIWEPLLAIADAAGGPWPQRARDAAVAMVKAASESTSQSLNVRLLDCTRVIFAAAGNPDHIPTDELLNSLLDMDEEPWHDLRGKPLDARGLAHRLRKYDVRPEQYRDGMEKRRGYRRADLSDAWTRYLPSAPEHPVQAVQPVQAAQTPPCATCRTAPREPGRATCQSCASIGDGIHQTELIP